MLITSDKPSALRMKEISDRKNNTPVDYQKELLIEMKDIYDKIEYAAKKGKYETVYILDEVVSKNKEIVNIILNSLCKEGFTAEIKARMGESFLYVSWNDVVEKKAGSQSDNSLQRDSESALKDEGTAEVKDSVESDNVRKSECKPRTDEEVLELGTKALISELGYSGFIRFISLILRGEYKDTGLYNEFLRYSYKDLKELFKNSKTKEERDFYIALSNLVLQREQEKVISEGEL